MVYVFWFAPQVMNMRMVDLNSFFNLVIISNYTSLICTHRHSPFPFFASFQVITQWRIFGATFLS